MSAYAIVVALGSLLVGAPAPDAAPLTLSIDACVDRAVQYSPLLAAARHEIAAAEAAKDAVRGRMWPKITASSIGGPVSEARGDAMSTTTPVDDYAHLFRNIGPFFRAELSIVQPLWTFGKLSYGEQAMAELTNAKMAQGQAQRVELVRQTEHLFWSLIYLNEVRDLLDDAMKARDEASKKLEVRIAAEDAGVSPTDRLRLRVFTAELRARRHALDAKLTTARDALSRLMNVPTDAWQPNVDRLRPVTLRSLDNAAIVESGLDRNPGRLRIEHVVAAAEAEVRRRGAELYPDLFLAGRLRYGWAGNRDDQQSPFAKDDFNFFDAGIALGLRYAWDIGVPENELRRAEARLAAYTELGGGLSERVRHEIIRGLAELHRRGADLDVRQDAVRAARAWSVASLNGFELGTTSSKDVIDAVTAYFEARHAWLETIFEYNKTVSDLSASTGEKLREFTEPSN